MIFVTQKYQAGFLISKIQKIGQQLFYQKLAENNLIIPPGEGRILFVLWNKDNIPIKELVKKTGLPKTTLTSILDRLEKDDQIIREPSKKDGREINIKLTKKNQKSHPIYEKVSKEMEEIYYSGFIETDMEELDKFLNRILDNLQVS
ncbi:MAG: MarR family winged helix-turn-helix transcriptional regulator [Promethearchaeota archaeon]